MMAPIHVYTEVARTISSNIISHADIKVRSLTTIVRYFDLSDSLAVATRDHGEMPPSRIVYK